METSCYPRRRRPLHRLCLLVHRINQFCQSRRDDGEVTHEHYFWDRTRRNSCVYSCTVCGGYFGVTLLPMAVRCGPDTDQAKSAQVAGFLLVAQTIANERAKRAGLDNQCPLMARGGHANALMKGLVLWQLPHRIHRCFSRVMIGCLSSDHGANDGAYSSGQSHCQSTPKSDA